MNCGVYNMSWNYIILHIWVWDNITELSLFYVLSIGMLMRRVFMMRTVSMVFQSSLLVVLEPSPLMKGEKYTYLYTLIIFYFAIQYCAAHLYASKCLLLPVLWVQFVRKSQVAHLYVCIYRSEIDLFSSELSTVPLHLNIHGAISGFQCFPLTG